MEGGDRVGVCPTTSAGAPGYSSGGGFAEKMVIGQQALVRMPVYVAEINEATWDLGLELGAKQIAKGITDFAGVGLDLIVDHAGFGTTTNAAIGTARLGGTVVLVGMGKLEANIDTKKLITNQTTLIGSNGGTPDDIQGVYELIAKGDLSPVYTVVDFEEIPVGLGRLMRHEVKGRLVAHVAD